MSKKMNKLITAVMIGSTISVPVFAESGFNHAMQKTVGDQFNYSNKAVHIRDKQQNKIQLVKLNVTPHKNAYRTNERISFTVSGNKNYYLYVFNIDPKTRKHTMLIPNRNTKDHALRAYKRYHIPGTVEFYSNQPGIEKLVFVGTNKPLPLSRTSSMSKAGEFASYDSKDINDNVLESKAIFTRPVNSSSPYRAIHPTVVNVRVY